MRHFYKYIFYVIFLFFTLLAVYVITSPAVDDTAISFYAKDFFLAASITALPFIINKRAKLRDMTCELTLGLIWTFSAPLISYWTYGSANLRYDIISGCYVFSLLVLLKWFFSRYFNRLLTHIILICINVLLLLPPLLNIICYLLYKHPLTYKAMIAIYQTNLLEAKEYLLGISFFYYTFFVLAIIATIYLYQREEFLNTEIYSFNDLSMPKLIPVILIIPTLTIWFVLSIFQNTEIISIANETHHYFTSLRNYNDTRKALLTKLHITPQHTEPKTIVVVIGESASRDYMQVYTPMKEQTTPWLNENKNNFYFFSHAYSCAYSTIVSLQHSLTEANYYNNMKFNDSLSIIDVAKAAGYKTYWFSSQSKMGIYDTPVTLIAEQSDISNWQTGYDGNLLQFLKQVNKNENNLVILHLLGSHAFFTSRYPKEFQFWTNPNVSGGLEDYKNTIAYTDKVLSDFFDYSSKNLNLEAFIYFSDHGVEPTVSRDPDSHEFVTLRIPFFLYLSPKYKTVNPQISLALEQNKNKAFSNDLIYNLLCTLMNLDSNYFNESESIASEKYKYNKENTKIDFGQKLTKDDPDY